MALQLAKAIRQPARTEEAVSDKPEVERLRAEVERLTAEHAKEYEQHDYWQHQTREAEIERDDFKAKLAEVTRERDKAWAASDAASKTLIATTAKVAELTRERDEAREKVDDANEESEMLQRRTDELEDECRCPVCRCCCPSDADGAECGCDSPVCNRTEVTLAGEVMRLSTEVAAMRPVVEAMGELLAAHEVNASIGSPTSQQTVAREAGAWVAADYALATYRARTMQEGRRLALDNAARIQANLDADRARTAQEGGSPAISSVSDCPECNGRPCRCAQEGT